MYSYASINAWMKLYRVDAKLYSLGLSAAVSYFICKTVYVVQHQKREIDIDIMYIRETRNI